MEYLYQNNHITHSVQNQYLPRYADQSLVFVKAFDTMVGSKLTTRNENPQWTVEKMPRARVMADMTLSSNGDVLLINSGID
ncbi:hypothetical protein YC2023_094652 [Brassica napus]